MAAGVPVVAAKVGGVPEIVVHEKTGVLIKPGDNEALGKAIIQILNGPDYSLKFTESAKENVMKKHSVNHMIEKLEDLYNDLLERHNG
jgi:glycosyltransferase involved in cell wall biosynthesis